MRKKADGERKAQVFVFDLIVAIIIFSLVLTVYNSWRDLLYANQVQNEEFQRASAKAGEAAFMLLETPGVPSTWNASNVVQVGLAYQRNVVDTSRLANFLNLTYANATQLLDVGMYYFYFELRFLNGTLVSVNYSGIVANATMGTLYDNYSIQVPLRKLVLYNGQDAIMFLRVAR